MACIKSGSQLDKDRMKWEAHLVAQGVPAPQAAVQAQQMATNSAIHTLQKRKQQLALQAAKQNAITAHVAAGGKSTAAARLDSLTQRDTRGRWNDTVNVVSAQKAHRAVAMAKMSETVKISETAAKMDKVSRKALDTAIRRELGGISTGNATAAKAARGLESAVGYLKAKANSLGMDIRTLADWAYPQRWAPEKVAPGGDSSRWVSAMYVEYTAGRMAPLLDDNGAPLMGQELRDAIAGMAENIRTGNIHGTIGVLPGAMKSRHKQPRAIRFLDMNNRMRFEDEFGEGDIFASMQSHVEGLAREVGVLDVFGPNPDRTYGVAREAAAKAGVAPSRLWLSDITYQYATGALNRPAVPGLARAGQGSRGILTGALLTASLPSQFTDVIPRALVASANGIPVFREMGDFFASLGKTMTPDDVAMVTRLGVDAETALMRLTDDGVMDSAQGVYWMTEKVMRWSGMQKWNQNGAISTNSALLRAIADNRSLSFVDADAAMGGKLTQYGYTPQTWDDIRTHGIVRETNGLEYASVLALENSPLSVKERGDAIQRMIHHVGSETNLAMTIPQPKARAIMAGGAQSGTPMGEAARGVTQFKSFSTQFVMNQVGEMFRKHGADRASHAAVLFVGTVALGMVAMQTKRLLKGQGIADMSEPGTWGAAAMQGGGLGIVGDFMAAGFGGTNRFGQGALTTLMGPSFGFAEDFIKTTAGNIGEAARGERANFASEAVRFGSRYTPGLHLPILGIAAERLFVDQIRLIADPSGTRRSFMTMEQKQRHDFNSKYLWRPGQVLPEALR